MAQPNDIFVDPSIAGDSGTGSSGDPYGDLEYALEQTTPNANGDRFNIKAGTDEVLEFALDIVTDYGTPTNTAPLIFQGYTSAAGDGGIGGISGGGSVAIVNSGSLNYVSFIDMHLHNVGNNVLVHLGAYIGLINCEINNSTSTSSDCIGANSGTMVGCYVHDINGQVNFNGHAMHNVFENGASNDFSVALHRPTVAYRNIFILDSSSIGIRLNGGSAINNSIYCNAGTGQGINIEETTPAQFVINNLIEGFSGAGGDAVGAAGANSRILVFGGNSEYDCTNGFATMDWVLSDLGTANELLIASPFNAAGTDDFAPVDTGAVKEGSIPGNFGDGAI